MVKTLNISSKKLGSVVNSRSSPCRVFKLGVKMLFPLLFTIFDSDSSSVNSTGHANLSKALRPVSGLKTLLAYFINISRSLKYFVLFNFISLICIYT